MKKDELSPLQKSALIIEKLKADIELLTNAQERDIAVVGMACRFPGGANTPEKFWKLLEDNIDTAVEIPKERFDLFDYYDPSPAVKGKINTRYAHLIDNPLDFDPAFFNISNREAESMDPQHRLLLEVAWEALENAGTEFRQLVDSKTGIFVGIGQMDYLQCQLNDLNDEEIDTYSNSGSSFSFAAGRLAYYLGVRGPCLAVDTACSSSLTTMHLACNSLLARESDQAIVAGVQLILSPKTMVGLSRLRALSPDGRCKPFSAEANGFGRGEGCGVIVLKRLKDAVESRDNILAVIKSSGVNHNGASSGLTVPNGNAQGELIATVLKNANLLPDTISYIEAHGTGTELGDPVEVGAIAHVFKQKRNPLYIGSVKGNIGHLEAAAGIASVIKVILSLKKGVLPKSLHSQKLNPHINWQASHIHVVQNNIPWVQDGNQARIAGISSFGMGGTNAHIIVSDYVGIYSSTQNSDNDNHLITISAKSPRTLHDNVTNLINYLEDKTDVGLGDFCFSLNCGRKAFNYRVAQPCDNKEELLTFLRKITSEEIQPCKIDNAIQPRLAFVINDYSCIEYSKVQKRYHTDPVIKKLMDSMLAIIPPANKSQISASLFSTIYQIAQYQLFQQIKAPIDLVIGEGSGGHALRFIAGLIQVDELVALLSAPCRQQKRNIIPIRDGNLIDLPYSEDDRLEQIMSNMKITKVIGYGISTRGFPAVDYLFTGDLDSQNQVLVALYLIGSDLDLAHLYPDASKCVLPTTSFQHKPWWYMKREPLMMQNRENRIQTIQERLCSNLAQLLSTEPQQLDLDASLLELGADSIILVEAIEIIEKEFGLKLAVRQLFEETNTLSALATYITDNTEDKAPASPENHEVASKTVEKEELAGHKKVIPEITESTIEQIALETSPYNSSLPEPKKVVGTSTHGVQYVIEQQLKLMQDLFGQQLAAMKQENGQKEIFQVKESVLASKTNNSAAISRPWAVMQTQRRQLSPLQQAWLGQFVADYTQRTSKSKKHQENSRKLIADFRNSVGFRMETKSILYPLVTDKAHGSHIWDIDGNEYVDYCLGYGVHFFGHSPTFLNRALQERLEEGFAIGPQSHLSLNVANMIHEMTGMERVVFCNSGTHAVDTAIRIARAYSQSKKIITFTGSYHGHSDHTLVFSRKNLDCYESFTVAPGISDAIAEHVTVLPYGDNLSLDYIRKHAADIAAVLVEPVQSRQPDIQPKEFLKQLRQLTTEQQIILIFDEMVNGFRIHQGGAQAWFGVRADIVTYGKLIASGLPIGVVAGCGRFLDCIDGGAWQFEGESYPQKETTFFGGTFNQNPLTMTAAHAVMRYLREQGPELQETLNLKADSLVSRVNAFLVSEDYPLRMVNFGSMMRFTMPGNASYLYQPLEMDLFYSGMVHRGVYIWEGRTCYISTAHTDEDINFFIDAVKDTLITLRKNGFFPGSSSMEKSVELSFPRSLTKTTGYMKSIYGIDCTSHTVEDEKQSRFWERSQSRLAHISTKSSDAAHTLHNSKLKIGISFFGSYPNDYHESKYDLVISASQFADRHDFSAVWLPERHFHEFGGLSPNPSVLCAAISQVTQRIQLRAGSVVLPLHHPIRVAEDWSIIDNLSNGRVGISFASGWHPDDFALAQNAYGQQREIMFDAIPIVQDLWEGKSITVDNGKGSPIQVNLFPMPKQEKLPIWLTVVNNADMYRKAGQTGVGILTNLLGQSLDDLKRNIVIYRESLKENGFLPQTGNVTVLLHTFLLADASSAIKHAKKPFCDYLKSSVNLFKNLISSEKLDINIDTLSEEDKDFILEKAYENYVSNNALIGSPQSVAGILGQLQAAGVDEIACFIDFGIDPDKVKEGLVFLNELNQTQLKSTDVFHSDLGLTYPLTREQQQMFALHKINPEACLAYNEACVLRFKGALQLATLEEAIRYTINRHVALRTVFSEDGSSQGSKVHFNFSIMSEPASDIPQQIKDFRDRPFDLQHDLPTRVLLLCVNPEEFILVLVCNHILVDGWSMGVILKDISDRYIDIVEGKKSNHGNVIGFDKFIERRNQRLLSNDMQTQKVYWLGLFKAGFFRTQLPYQKSPMGEFLYKAARQTIKFNQSDLKQLNKIAAKQKATLFMLLFAAYGYLLHFLTQQKKLVIGIPVSGREHKDDNLLVGYCTYLLPIVCTYNAGEAFSTYFERTKQILLDAFEHQHYPFGSLTEALMQSGITNPSEIIRVIFNLDRPVKVKQLPNISVEVEHQEVSYKAFDLDFNILNLGDHLVLDCDYLSQRFSDHSISRWLAYYQAIIQLINSNSKLNFQMSDLLSDSEKRFLMQGSTDTEPQEDEKQSIPEVFTKVAKKDPHAIALITDTDELTYGQLDKRSNQLANYLVSVGIVKQRVIAIYLERTPELIVSLLGVLKIGASYLILDSKMPVQRLACILEDAAADLIITTSSMSDDLPETGCYLLCLDKDQDVLKTQEDFFELPQIEPELLAYLCYTSGTTGKPKGVMIPHRGVLRLTQNVDYLSLNAEDIFIQLSALNFDAATFEIWMPLLNGASLVLPDPSVTSIADMAKVIKEKQVSTLWLTAGLFQLFVQYHCEDLSSIKQLIAGGDVLPIEQVNQFLSYYPDKFLINGYGPTEATTFSCTYRIPTGHRIVGNVPIGKPINRTRVYVLNNEREIVPAGSVGELYISGDGVGLGYLNDPELSAQKFLPEPFSTAKNLMYKTGDLVRYNEEGFLEFIGRQDDQIKINGYRIESQDIENVFNQGFDSIVASKLLTIDGQDDKKLALCYFSDSDTAINVGLLRQYALSQLPTYAVPHYFFPIEHWPLTSSGKVDVQALLRSFEQYQAIENNREPPLGEVEIKIASIWEKLFNRVAIGRHDNFFDLGGDSITALRLAALIKEELGFTVNPNYILTYSTVCALSNYLLEGNHFQVSAQLLTGEVPLTPIQHWFFARQLKAHNYFHQMIAFEIVEDFSWALFTKAVGIVMRHYDAFRLRFKPTSAGWTQYYLDEEQHKAIIGRACLIHQYETSELHDYLYRFQSEFNIENGCVFKVAYLTGQQQQPQYLILSAHHLIVDGVSWRLILANLMTVYEQLVKNVKPVLPTQTSSYKDWSLAIKKLSKGNTLDEDRRYWDNFVAYNSKLPCDFDNQSDNLVRDERIERYHANLLDLQPINQTTLLISLIKGLGQMLNQQLITIDVEGHGRDLHLDGIDVSNTVGWFTSIYPASFRFDSDKSIEEQVGELLSTVPHNGTTYGLLTQYDEAIRKKMAGHRSAICFNYLGKIDQGFEQTNRLELSEELHIPERDINQARLYELEIVARIIENKLEVAIHYPSENYKEKTIRNLLDTIISFLSVNSKTSFFMSSEALGDLVVPLNNNKSKEGSIIFLPGTGGNVIYFHNLAKKIETALPCYGIQAPGLYDDRLPLETINCMAKTYVQAIRDANVNPPYHFIGHSMGAINVFEIVQMLNPDVVGRVILLDMMAPVPESLPIKFPESKDEWMLYALRHMERYFQMPLALDAKELDQADEEEKYQLFKQVLCRSGAIPTNIDVLTVKRFINVLVHNTIAYKNYRPNTRVSSELHLIKAGNIHDDDFRPEALLNSHGWGWEKLASQVHAYQMSSGDHLSMFTDPAVKQLAELIENIVNLEIMYG